MRFSTLLSCIAVTSLFLSSCNSTQNNHRLVQWAYAENAQVSQYRQQIQSQFPIAKAQIISLSSIAGFDFDSETDVVVAYKKLASIESNFIPRASELNRRTNAIAKNLQSQHKIEANDTTWQSFQQYKQYAENEFEALTSLGQDFTKAHAGFNKALSAPEYSQYAKQLPQTPWQAHTIIQTHEAEDNRERYNEAVLAALSEKLANVDLTNFEALSQLVDLASFSGVDRAKYGQFPRREESLTPKTRDISRQLIQSAISGHLSRAAYSYAAQFEDISAVTYQLSELDNENSPHRPLSELLSDTQKQQVANIFNARKAEIIEQLILAYKRLLDAALIYAEQATTRLQTMVAHSDRFMNEHGNLRMFPAVQTYLDEQQNERLALLRGISQSALQNIESATSLAQLNTVLFGLIAKADYTSDVAQQLKQAQTSKLNRLTAFVPATDQEELSIRNFSAKNLNYESELTAIYLGDFDHARLSSDSLTVGLILNDYMHAYGRYCDSELPANKVPITREECATESVTTDGWGVETSRVCVNWVEIPTGLYADPVIYNTSKRLASSASLDMFGDAMQGDWFAGKSILDDKVSLGDDMEKLVNQNQCNNKGLKRFEENLLRFIHGQSGIRLPSGMTLADVQSVYKIDFAPDDLNLSRLLDDLILENAQAWMLNRYYQGSVADIAVIRTSNEGYPLSVKASYQFNTMGQNSLGEVVLSFADNIPKCLYFSDAPDTCRHPSRGIINRFEKGEYVE
uniref:hypothetical protein n=1 Tax=Ningiella ruwaisensis TaxID=2364274 RepID=UPI00109F18B3|nr:hypothetical protein [Ningiella ruwaisensis]